MHHLKDDRIRRLKEWQENLTANNYWGIILDRMMYMDCYHDAELLAIIVRTSQPLGEDMREPIIHYTNDEWKTVQYHYRIDAYEEKVMSDHIEHSFMYLLNAEKCNWFALGLIIDEKSGLTQIWDNNKGWNYSNNQHYHWIPTFHVDKFYYLDIEWIPSLKDWEDTIPDNHFLTNLKIY